MKPADLNQNDRSVLKTLDKSTKPLSAYDILDRARSDALKAPVQVYRALEKLANQGLVHRIEALNAFVACSDCSHAGHRHEGEGAHPRAAGRHKPAFLICKDCGAVREFEDMRIDGIAAEAAGPSFAVELVSLEVFGRCSECRGAVA